MNEITEKLVELEIPRKAEYVVIARLVSGALARKMRFDPETVDDIKLAISESCNTILRSPKSLSSDNIKVSCSLSGDDLKVIVKDKGFEQGEITLQEEIESLEADDEERFRVSLIRSLVDDLKYLSSKGRHYIQLTKKADSLQE